MPKSLTHFTYLCAFVVIIISYKSRNEQQAFGVRLKTSITYEDQDKLTKVHAILQFRILYSSVFKEKNCKTKL